MNLSAVQDIKQTTSYAYEVILDKRVINYVNRSIICNNLYRLSIKLNNLY